MEASHEFAKLNDLPTDELRDSWFNNGPQDLTKDLPKDWRLRIVSLYKGKSLTLFTLGRTDLLCSKLFALCDRGTDIKDCLAMKPTLEELKECIKWVVLRDANPDWPKHVENTFKKLAKKAGYEF